MVLQQASIPCLFYTPPLASWGARLPEEHGSQTYRAKEASNKVQSNSMLMVVLVLHNPKSPRASHFESSTKGSSTNESSAHCPLT